MKYRILKNRYRNFYVERKFLCFWIREQEGVGWGGSQPVSFNNKNDAEKYIDKEIEFYNRKEECWEYP